MYVGLIKERHPHLKKRASTGLYNNTSIDKFVCSVYSLSVPFSLLREPWFDLNKSTLEMDFPPGFFQGFIPENIGVFCGRFCFPSLCFHYMFSWLLVFHFINSCGPNSYLEASIFTLIFILLGQILFCGISTYFQWFSCFQNLPFFWETLSRRKSTSSCYQTSTLRLS